MGIAQCLDIFTTVIEAVTLYIISRALLEKPRFPMNLCKYMPPVAMFLITCLLTWFSELGAFKMPLLLLLAVIVLKIAYKESIYQNIIVAELWFICDGILVEALLFPISKVMFGNDLFVWIDGQNLLRWEMYVIAIAIRIVSMIIIYVVLKNFKYKIKAIDCVVLSGVFMIGFTMLMFSVYNVLNLSKIPHMLIFVGMAIFTMIFIVVFLYSKNLLNF